MARRMTDVETRFKDGAYDPTRLEELYDSDESPEKKLGVAVIVRALRDAMGSTEDKPRRYGDRDQVLALHWIELAGMEPKQFDWWCEMVDLDPVRIRQHVLSRVGNEAWFKLKSRVVAGRLYSNRVGTRKEVPPDWMLLALRNLRQ